MTTQSKIENQKSKIPDLTVTLIAPETPGLEPLGWLSEIGTIANMPGVRLAIVGGDVREHQAAAALRSRRRPDDLESATAKRTR